LSWRFTLKARLSIGIMYLVLLLPYEPTPGAMHMTVAISSKPSA